MAYYDPTRDRKLIEKRASNSVTRSRHEGSLPPNLESQVDKDALTVSKGFVFLPGNISDNIQQLKLHLQTGYIYNVKNDHCATSGCPGMFNRRGHNAHPIHSRIKMHLEAFRWQVRLFLLHEGDRVSLKKAIEICYQDWPLELEKNPAQLYESLKTSLYTFQRAGKEENGEPTFMKKSFLHEYPQKKLDRLIAALRLDTNYWGPYTSPKSADTKGIDKVSKSKRRRENVSPLRSSGSAENEMNPKKKPRQETDKDPNGVKKTCSSENAKATNGEKISSKSKDKISSRVTEEENKSRRKEKRSSDGSKKKRNSDTESKGSRNSVKTSTPKEKEAAGLDGEVETLSPKGNSIPSSAELTPISGLEVNKESGESTDLMEVRRLLEEVRMEAERKSREAEHLKKALAHLLSYRIESDGSNLSQEKIDAIIQLDGKTSDERLNVSGRDRLKEMVNKLPVSSRRKFIDGIINFIFHVEKEDKFRFQLIQEEDATRTNCIKVYDIHHCEGFLIPFSMTIVDTPSFDSYPEELEIFKDKEIIEMFHEFFENKESVKELDMICNVGDEICPSFLSVFANDLKENIHCLEPNNYMSDTWQDDVQIFVTLLSTMKKKSLSLTKQVLEERKRIESKVYEIRSLITTGLTMTEEMTTAKQIASNCQTYVQQNGKEFQSEVKLEAIQQVELPAGQFANNCNNCNVMCSSSVFMAKMERPATIGL